MPLLRNYNQVDQHFFIEILGINFLFLLDESHELLPSELRLKAPAIIIHTCDDNMEGNNLDRNKLIKPTLMQTKRPPRIEGHI